jgi:hypothetical protein|nr:MAG TPA: Gas vesicle protein G [Caudoviricetes sp.]
MNEKRMEIESEITGLKQILASTDYKALKYAEGQITEKDYEETKQERQSLRDKINELEAELATIGESEESADAE